MSMDNITLTQTGYNPDLPLIKVARLETAPRRRIKIAPGVVRCIDCIAVLEGMDAPSGAPLCVDLLIYESGEFTVWSHDEELDYNPVHLSAAAEQEARRIAAWLRDLEL